MDNEKRSLRWDFTRPDFRAAGRQALTGHWGLAVVVMIVAALLGGIGNSFSVDLNIDLGDGGYYFDSSLLDQIQYYLEKYRYVISALSILGMVQFIIGGTIEIGYKRFNLHLVDGQEARFGDLFSAFNIFGQAFWLRLRVLLQTIAWALLLIVPGIVAAYRYSMAPYIMAENPNIEVGEAIERSKAMMDGHKMELFLLHLSFLGWLLLSVLTLGILSLWVTPYMQTTEAYYYRRLNEAQNPQPKEPDWTDNY